MRSEWVPGEWAGQMDRNFTERFAADETRAAPDTRLAPMNGKTSGAWRDGLLLFAFNLIIFWKLILTGEYTILWSGDNALQAYPWYQFLATSLHQHSFPFWNTYSEAGRLFIGEPTTGAFYPFNLLLALLPLNARGMAPAWGLEYS